MVLAAAVATLMFILISLQGIMISPRLRSAMCNSQLLRLYSSDPLIHNLVSFVRLWAQCHELSGESGGCFIKNYALTLIVLFFCMNGPKIIPLVSDLAGCVEGTQRMTLDGYECLSVPLEAKLPPRNYKRTDVHLLKEFFSFSSTIDWENDVLLLNNASVMSKKDLVKDPYYAKCKLGHLMVIDPFLRHQNVLRNVDIRTKDLFVRTLKKSAELTCNWPISVPREEDIAWGIAELLIKDVRRPSSTMNGMSSGQRP